MITFLCIEKGDDWEFPETIRAASADEAAEAFARQLASESKKPLGELTILVRDQEFYETAVIEVEWQANLHTMLSLCPGCGEEAVEQCEVCARYACSNCATKTGKCHGPEANCIRCERRIARETASDCFSCEGLLCNDCADSHDYCQMCEAEEGSDGSDDE